MKTIAIEHLPCQSAAGDLFNIGQNILHAIFWPFFFLLPVITGFKIMVAMLWRILVRC